MFKFKENVCLEILEGGGGGWQACYSLVWCWTVCAETLTGYWWYVLTTEHMCVSFHSPVRSAESTSLGLGTNLDVEIEILFMQPIE